MSVYYQHKKTFKAYDSMHQFTTKVTLGKLSGSDKNSYKADIGKVALTEHFRH